MKTEILDISKQLENDEISYQDARKKLCKLFGVKYKSKVAGRAIVKGNGWVYYGHELTVIEHVTTYENGYGVYPDGTRVFRLSLVGTEFEMRNGCRQTNTVIPETDLEIIELNEE